MAKCKECGKKFDVDEAREEFESECCKSYDNLYKTLCAECAIEAVESRWDGYYFEICEKCGKEFDLFMDESEFELEQQNDNCLQDYWDDGTYGILCAECAIDKACSMEELEYEDDDDN